MRKYITLVEILNEAPISNIELWGEEGKSFDDGTTFSKTDTKLLSSEKGRAKIIRAFKKTPFNFEVIFLNSTAFDANRPSANSEIDTHIYKNGVGIHDEYQDIKGKPGIIRVLMLGNLSLLDGKIPMTGWILAHKIGHSFQDSSPKFKDLRVLGAELLDAMYTEQNPFPLTSRSAEFITNEYEVFPEMVAQYLVTGKVTINSPKRAVQQLVDRFNQELTQTFKSLEGKVIVEL